MIFKLQQLLQAASVYRKPRPKQYCSSKRLRRQEENKEQKKNENPRRIDKKKMESRGRSWESTLLIVCGIQRAAAAKP